MSYRTPTPTSSGTLGLVFGTGLPVAAILIEVITGWCAGALFDPLPSFAHLLLASAVPIVNLLLWMLLRNDMAGPKWVAVAGGAAIVVAGTYALLFLPILPIATIGILFLGVGLLPFAPLFAMIATIRWMKRIDEWTVPIRRWVALGVGLGFLLLTAADLPATAVHTAINRYSGSESDRASAVRLMRAVGDRDMLLRLAYGEGARATGLVSLFTSSWANGVWGGDRGNGEAARELYYRVTGEPFNARPMPTNGFAARHRWFRSDDDLGGERVGARVDGLSLASSRIDVSAAEQDNLAYTEWTIEIANAAAVQNEGRFTLAMPEGAVASRATLWVNGEPREASVAGRAEVRAAYSKVVNARRDPLLVTTNGAGRLLVQAFPILPGERMKFRVGYTAPLKIAADGRRTQALPAIVERNFEIVGDLRHHVWIAGDAPLGWSNDALRSASAPLRASFSDSHVLSARPRFQTVALDAPSLRTGHIAAQGKRPALAVEQLIDRTKDETRALMIVLDGSVSMASAGAAMTRALDALPPGLPVGLAIASDQMRAVDPAPWSPEQRTRMKSALAGSSFRGGQDNLPALTEALSRMSVPGGRILWVHGAQPVDFERSRLALDQFLDRTDALPGLIRYQPEPGRAFSVQGEPLFETAQMVTPGMDTVADLRAIFSRLSGPVWQTRYRKVTSGQRSGSAHIVRLWAAGELSDEGLLSGDARDTSIALAHRLNLITPISGAVVLETDRDYKENDLPIPSAEDVPTIPEPEVWAMLLILAGCFGWMMRRRLAATPRAIA